MALTVFLAKVFGIYLMIVGATIMLRRDYFVPVFATFAKERLARAVVALFELLGGLFLVVAHNQWSPLPAAIITLFGWLAVVESAAYLLLSDEAVEGLLKVVNTPAWYVGGGLIAIAVGIYLTGFGFGWL